MGLVRRAQEELRAIDPLLFTYTDRDNEGVIVVNNEDFLVMVESFQCDDRRPIVTSHYLYEFIENEVACPALAKRVLNRHLTYIRKSVNTAADVLYFKWLLEQTRVVLLRKGVSEEEIGALLAFELAKVNRRTETSQTDQETIDLSIEDERDSGDCEEDPDDLVLRDLLHCTSPRIQKYGAGITYFFKADDTRSHSEIYYPPSQAQQSQTSLLTTRDLQNDKRPSKENDNESTLPSCLLRI